jgi:hypothetical protein
MLMFLPYTLSLLMSFLITLFSFVICHFLFFICISLFSVMFQEEGKIPKAMVKYASGISLESIGAYAEITAK